MTAQEQLIELIDSRINAKKTQYPAIVTAVSEFSEKATVRFPEGNLEIEFLNKTREALAVGDSVYIYTNDGNLSNGYIFQRFNNSSSVSLNPDGSLKTDSVTKDNIARGEVGNYQIQNGSVTTHELHSSVGHLLDITKNESVSPSKYFIETIEESLQGQIDGNMTSWFYEYTPTADNLPASEWITVELKAFHLKDLFYDMANKLVYRYTLLDGVYSWKLITDSNVIFALDNASKAQDTADGKRRVFTEDPVGSYDIGDLWITVEKDLMVCIQERVADEGVSYDPLHWEKAVKYTDDTVADDAITRIQSAEQKITPEGITNTVRSSEEYINDLGEKVSQTEAVVIAQTAQNVLIGFNGINNNIQFDLNGITVNQGSYFVADNYGVINTVGSLSNFIPDSGFETFNYGTIDATYKDSNFIEKNIYVSDGRWNGVNSAKLVTPAIAGQTSVACTSTNWIDGIFSCYPSKTYTFSFLCSPHLLRNTSGSTISYNVVIQERSGNLLNTFQTLSGTLKSSFITGATNYETNGVRRVVGTFTVPYGTSGLKFRLQSGSSTQWVVYDNFQLVEGYYPCLYTENSQWTPSSTMNYSTIFDQISTPSGKEGDLWIKRSYDGSGSGSIYSYDGGWSLFVPNINESNIFGIDQNLGSTGGYRKFPGGMIVQWGSVATGTMSSDASSGGYKKTISYPRAFSTAPVITVSPDYAAGFPKVCSSGNSASGVSIMCDVQLANCNVSWIATGY